MNMTQIRDRFVAHLEDTFVAAHPEIPLFYDNQGEIDLDNVGDHFITVNLHFYGARQSCLGESPFHRTYGSIVIILYSKIGLGMRPRLLLMDEITEFLKFQVLGGLHLQVPAPGRYGEREGWHTSNLAVPFFADSNA